MSVECQAIIAGHISAEEIVSLLRLEVRGKLIVRNMQRIEYKIIDLQQDDGSFSAINLFLESWAAEDYADAFQGPSTFLTAEYSPANFHLVRSVAAAFGGLARKTATEPWTKLDVSRV